MDDLVCAHRDCCGCDVLCGTTFSSSAICAGGSSAKDDAGMGPLAERMELSGRSGPVGRWQRLGLGQKISCGRSLDWRLNDCAHSILISTYPYPLSWGTGRQRSD